MLLKVREEGGLVVSDAMAAEEEEEEEDMNLLKCESDDEGFERRVRVAAIGEL